MSLDWTDKLAFGVGPLVVIVLIGVTLGLTSFWARRKREASEALDQLTGLDRVTEEIRQLQRQRK